MNWRSVAIKLFRLAILLGLLISRGLAAETPTTTPAIAEDHTRYLAKIELHTEGEIADLFERASQLLDQENSFALGEPIAFVLHGPEVEYFSKDNYREFKSIVDKAAQLDAFRVIDVRVCSTYMRLHNISPESLPPFVEVVPYGPDEERRLRSDGYVDF
ncbi:hypothetical protein BTA51_27930 [Hahella sp. CCB-MM4]|uniref:DsrE family protein n=1 Tax=Hahella sp. (strain CCB-MM4) TaxID=1926491 RepID=UPI000B9BF2FE|nr:DsrE family protein [Hahella sp. CCB-MM4]OZG70034.1 hypothetical protein BTA51_27930 [Hahella sp. CCB-MM4]